MLFKRVSDLSVCSTQVTNGIRLLFKTIRTLKENEETKAVVDIPQALKKQVKAVARYFEFPTLSISLTLKSHEMGLPSRSQ